MQMVEEQILRGVQGPELNQQERGRRGRWNHRKRGALILWAQEFLLLTEPI